MGSTAGLGTRPAVAPIRHTHPARGELLSVWALASSRRLLPPDSLGFVGESAFVAEDNDEWARPPGCVRARRSRPFATPPEPQTEANFCSGAGPSLLLPPDSGLRGASELVSVGDISPLIPGAALRQRPPLRQLQSAHTQPQRRTSGRLLSSSSSSSTRFLGFEGEVAEDNDDVVGVPSLKIYLYLCTPRARSPCRAPPRQERTSWLLPQSVSGVCGEQRDSGSRFWHGSFTFTAHSFTPRIPCGAAISRPLTPSPFPPLDPNRLNLGPTL